MVSRKASRETWLTAGCAALRRGGFAAVQVEPLASVLGVTKGSFYWHFKNRNELVDTLISRWEQETDMLIGAASKAASPLARLISFFSQVENVSDFPPDYAIFEIARMDRRVAVRASKVEQARIDYVAAQLRKLGLNSSDARKAAELVYCTTVGWLEFARRNNRDPEGFAAAAVRVIAGQFALVRSGAAPHLDDFMQASAR